MSARRPLTRLFPPSLRRSLTPLFSEGPLNPVLDFGAGLRRGLERGPGRRYPLDPALQILLVGSGRSGTTWITEALSALRGTKQLFEPLHPQWVRAVRRVMPPHEWGPFPNAQGPFLPATADAPEWEAHWRQILEGRIRCHWTDRFQRSGGRVDRLVVKSVRANRMLGFILDRLSPRLLYVQRHPVPVVWSRVGRGWHADPRLLLRDEEFVAAHLDRWIGDIERCSDAWSAHAIWWAAENAAAEADLRTRPHVFTTFERLCTEGESELARITSELDLPLPDEANETLGTASQLSDERRRYAKGLDRVNGWCGVVGTDQAATVIRWADRLGLRRYDEHPFPKESWALPFRESLPSPDL